MRLVWFIVNPKNSNPICIALLALAALCALTENAFATATRFVSSPAKRYVITDFGAVADGQTVNTKAIQSAIDACATSHGGVVVVPKGIFMSGALFFRQGVNLLVEKDGVLKGTTNRTDYPQVPTRWEGIEREWTAALINATNMTGLQISGEGTIDGSGDLWERNTPRRRFRLSGQTNSLRSVRGAYATNQANAFAGGTNGPPRIGRPRLIVIKDCKNVRVSGLSLRNQASWGLVFIYCKNVVVEKLNIHVAQYVPSSDGIDVDSCRNVAISRCDIACYDDDISIKSGKDEEGLRLNRPAENITISDCVIGIGGGIAMGSEVSGSIRHVLVRRCTFTGSGSAARIKSQPSRGGVIEDITWRDIKLNHARQAFDFNLEWRMVPPIAPPAKVLTVARNIRLINFSGTAFSGGVMHGLKDSPIQDVKFRNCNVTAQRGLILANVKNPNLSGLKLTVAEGEPIIHSNTAAQPEEQQ